MKSKKLRAEISPERIAFLKFILDGYDHLALLTVKDPKAGIVELSFFPSEKEEVLKILKGFAKKIEEV
jgi:hypothetical protein